MRLLFLFLLLLCGNYSQAAAPEPTPTHELGIPSTTPDQMTSSYEAAFVKMILALLSLIFLVGLTIWALRRIGKLRYRGGSGRSIQILEKLPLSQKSMLYVVQVGNRRILLAESQLEVRALAPLEVEEVVERT